MCVCVHVCVYLRACVCVGVHMLYYKQFDNSTVRLFNHNCQVKLVRITLPLPFQCFQYQCDSRYLTPHSIFHMITRMNSFFPYTAICKILFMTFLYWAVRQVREPPKMTINFLDNFTYPEKRHFDTLYPMRHRDLFRFWDTDMQKGKSRHIYFD